MKFKLINESIREGWKVSYTPEVGDRVRITKRCKEHPGIVDTAYYIGQEGTITYVGSEYRALDTAEVEFDDGSHVYFSTSAFEPVEPKPQVRSSKNESKQINEELWNSTRVADLVNYYLDRNNYPINTLANLIKNQMEKEGSKLPYNVTDFYDALYMAVDRYNSQFDDGLDESKSIKAFGAKAKKLNENIKTLPVPQGWTPSIENDNHKYEYLSDNVYGSVYMYNSFNNPKTAKIITSIMDLKNPDSSRTIETEKELDSVDRDWDYALLQAVYDADDVISTIEAKAEAKKLTEGRISSVEPAVHFKGKSSHTFTTDKKWEVDFDEQGNILARTRHGKTQYFSGHINDKVNTFPHTDEDNIILAAREQHSLKFGNKSNELEEDWPKLLPIEEIPDNRKWQYSVGGVDVPYTSYEDAMAHLKDDYNIEDYRDELQKFIDKETGRPHTFFVDATYDGRLCIDISWGDWKHEHAYADYLVRKFFNDKGLGIDIETDTTESDGTDAYSATHYYDIDDLFFSGRVVEESLREGLNDYRFYVSCNDGPEKLIRTVAENEDDAIKYVKDMYAKEHTTYADDRANKWSIKNLDEALSENSTDMPYMFFYTATNSTFGYDFEEFAKSLGAKKAYGRYKGTGSGSYFYLVPSEEVYNELKKVAKKEYGVDMQRLKAFNSEEYPSLKTINESAVNSWEEWHNGVVGRDEYELAGPNGIIAHVWSYDNDGDWGYALNIEDGGKVIYKKDFEHTPIKDVKKQVEDIIKSYSSSINEASYGGAYDIDDEAYFTREDLVTFAEDVIEALDRQYDLKFDINELKLYKGVLYLSLVSKNGIELFHEQRIDMRKIKLPKDLNRYLDEFVTAFRFQIDDNADSLYESLLEYSNVSGVGKTVNYGPNRVPDSRKLGDPSAARIDSKSKELAAKKAEEEEEKREKLKKREEGSGSDESGQGDSSKDGIKKPSTDDNSKVDSKKSKDKSEDSKKSKSKPKSKGKLNDNIKSYEEAKYKLNTADTQQKMTVAIKSAKAAISKGYISGKDAKEIKRLIDNKIKVFNLKNNDKKVKEDFDYENDNWSDDGEVASGKSFIEAGTEYVWEEKIGSTVSMDFDNWSVWSARDIDNDILEYFIVEEDTGFIDWGPVDTAGEAREFLQSKLDDYSEEDSDEDPLDFIDYNESLTEDTGASAKSAISSMLKDMDDSEKASTVSKILDIIPDEYADKLFSATEKTLNDKQIPESDKQNIINQAEPMVDDKEKLDSVDSIGDLLNLIDLKYWAKKDPKMCKNLIVTILAIIAVIEPTPVVEIITVIVKLLPANVIAKIIKIFPGLSDTVGKLGSVMGESVDKVSYVEIVPEKRGFSHERHVFDTVDEMKAHIKQQGLTPSDIDSVVGLNSVEELFESDAK